MTLFELYTANVPLLVPSHQCVTKELGGLKSVFSYGNGETYSKGGHEGGKFPPTRQEFYLDRADFYDDAPLGQGGVHMPHIGVFGSMDALGAAVDAADPKAMSARMVETNRERAGAARAAWACLMREAFPQLGASGRVDRSVREG